MVKITIELGGGLELLFGKIKSHEVDIPTSFASTPVTSAASTASTAITTSTDSASSPSSTSSSSSSSPPLTIRNLLAYMRTSLLQERPELFLAGDTIRPGIMVLINDVDWELEGTLECELQDGDVIAFISTLHGG